MTSIPLWKWISVQGLLTLSFGLMALLWPGITADVLLALLIILGIGGTAAGVVAAVRREDMVILVITAALGVCAIGLALLGIFVPRFAVLVCLIAVLIQAVAGGIVLIGYGIGLRRRGRNGWPALVAGLLVALVGIGVWFLPPAAPDAVMTRIGGYALVQGLLLGGAGVVLFVMSRQGNAAAAVGQARV